MTPLLPEIVVDCFAGGGGASEGIEKALAEMGELDLLDGACPHVSIAINHDDEALAMHAANHPATLHLPVDIWRVDPRAAVNGNPVGLLWASPDCRHHSQAKGGKPVSESVRDLAWVVTHWAEQIQPRIIILENVGEFRDWGPLVPDGKGGLTPCKDRKGETFKRWVNRFRALGYKVEWRVLRACDYGAPTIRKRLYMIMRCDGKPIVWHAPTHGDPKSEEVKSGRLKPWPVAADIIDWDRPCPSILMTREEAKAYKRQTGTTIIRPLAYKTLARIARGIKRYVLDAADLFIVTCNHSSVATAPCFVSVNHGDSGGRREYAATEPFGTVTKHQSRGVVSAYLAQHNTGAVGRRAGEPFPTILSRGSTQNLVAAHMVSLKGSNRRARPVDTPHPAVTAGGQHSGVVTLPLIAAYYSEGGQHGAIDKPMLAVPTKDRFGLVDCNGAVPPMSDEQAARARMVAQFLREHGVWNDGEFVTVGLYVIVDIGMRMLTPRELARAQGFADTYILAAPYKGKVLTETSQRHKIGNSVCPRMSSRHVFDNYRPERRARYAAPQGWLFDTGSSVMEAAQ